MALCAVSNLSKYYGATRIFQNITFDIDKNQRIGLIGPNGVGKTTLFKIILGEEDYQEGDVFIRQDIRIDYLDQIPVYPEHYRTIDVLYLAFHEILTMQQQLKELEHQMTYLTGAELTQVIQEFGSLEQRYEQRGGYVIREKLNRILIGLKITEDLQDRPFNLLSGGEKSRIVLGKILLEEPDILLLDEPSNHLDMNFMDWLESYLQDYQGAVVIISHDRWFLNRTVNRIIELSAEEAEIYNGNYDYYLVEHKKRLEEKYKLWQMEQRKVDRMEAQIERYLIWARSRDSEKMFVRAKELKKRLAKLDVPDKPQMEQKSIRLNYDKATRSGREVFKLTDVSHTFEDNPLFEDINCTIYYQDRVAIIGANGAGKSTLLKIILGELQPTCGEAKPGSRLDIGYLPQEIEFSNPQFNLIEAFQDEHQITTTDARHQLAKVLFTGDDVFKSVSTLSGGERSRLKLCILMYNKINVLVLDEPTNHLDLTSREILEDSLKAFDGTIIFVSHDRYFIDSMATRLLEIENHHLFVYNGDYQYYLRQKEPQEVETANSKSQQGRQNYEADKEQQRKIRRYRKKLEQCEQRIQECEAALNLLSEQLNIGHEDIALLNKQYRRQHELEEELLLLLEKHELLLADPRSKL